MEDAGEHPTPAPTVGIGGLVAGCAAAALIWDPLTPAACPKRAVGMMVSIVGSALLLGGALRRDQKRPEAWSLGTVGFAVLAAWTLLSLAWGNAAGVGEVTTVVLMAAIAALTASQSEDRARRIAATTCAVIGGATTLAVLTQAVVGGQVHAGHGNANRAGLVLGVTLLPALGVTLSAWRRRRRGRHALLVLGGAWLVAQLLAQSHTSWVAVVGGLGVAGLTRGARGPRAPLVIALVPFAIGILAAVGAEPMASLLPDAIGRALRGRAWLWHCSWDAALGALPLGAGAGGFTGAYLGAQGTALAELSIGAAARHYHYVQYAHHDALHTFVVAGPVGVLLLLASLAVTLYDHVRSGQLWLAGSTAALIVAGSGDAALLQPACAVVAGLLVAAGSRRVAWTRGAPYRWGLLLVGTAWLLTIEARTWVAERWVTAARDALPQERLAHLRGAVKMQPSCGRAQFELGLAWLETGNAPGAIAALERASILSPGPTTLVALGNARVRGGDPGAAAETYHRAIALHPGSFRAHANLASVLTTLGRYEMAEQHLDHARSLYPGHPRLAQIADRLHRAEHDAATERDPASLPLLPLWPPRPPAP